MRLKSFTAHTMTEAMQMVRDTLGEDAVIVATREDKASRAVHVTAAVEPAFELGRNGASAPMDDWLQYDDEHDEEHNAVAEELTDVMLRHAVPEDVIDNVVSCATVIGLESPGVALIAALEHLFNFRPLPEKPEQKAMMMVGPPGAGKTLAVAKMAARGVMNDLKIGVISCDTVRAGGIEQLQAFTNLLQVDLKKAKTNEELHAAIAMMDNCDQVLIDTPGVNPFNAEDLKNIARKIGVADIEPYLVLPAGWDAQESGEAARAFAMIGAHNLISTRVDIARRLGGLLAAAHQGSLTFADASNTPKVADGLIAVTPKSLAALLMPRAFRKPAAQTIRKTGT